jgi:hypothetical protein
MVGFTKQSCFSSPFKVKAKFESDIIAEDEPEEEPEESFKKIQANARDADGWEDTQEKKYIPGERLLRKLNKMEQKKNKHNTKAKRKPRKNNIESDQYNIDIERISNRLSGIIREF